MLDRILAVLNEEFLIKNNDVDSLDELYERVHAVDPSINKEDFFSCSEVLSFASSIISDDGELFEEQLCDVAGGKAKTNVNINGNLDFDGNQLLNQIASVWTSAVKGTAKFIYNLTHKC